MYYCQYYYDTQRAHEAAHVVSRAGPGRGPCDVVYYCYNYDFVGVLGSLYANNYVLTSHSQKNSLRCVLLI